MSNLIKINNQQQVSGAINAYFQENIVVKPASKISLLNMSCQLEDRNIEITDQNNFMYARAADNIPNPYLGTGYRLVQLKNGLYDVNGFVKELNRAINSSLICHRRAESGFQWKVNLIENKVKIIFNRTPKSGFIYQLKGREKFIQGATATTANNGYEKPAASGDNWKCGIATMRPFVDGCGTFSVVRSGIRNNPVIVGLLDSNNLEDYSVGADYDFNVSNYKFAIYSRSPISNDTGPHIYVCRYLTEGGTIEEFETNVAPANHYIGLMLSGGKLVFYKTGPNEDQDVAAITGANILHEIDWVYGNKYFGMISIYNEDTQVLKCNFWPDPYLTITNTISHYHIDEPPLNMQEEDIDNIEVGGAASSNVSISFRWNNTESKALGQLIGFRNQTYTSANVKSGSFQAEKQLTDIVLPQNLKVLLDNFPLPGYDNISAGHESILLTVPTLTANNGKFIYDAPFLLNVRIDNEYTINLSEVRLRLVDFKNKPIKVMPDLCDITLIISE